MAEEMFAAGCELLISVTSSGQISAVAHPSPIFVSIDKAPRDESASYQHLPPSDYTHLDARFDQMLDGAHDALALIRAAARS